MKKFMTTFELTDFVAVMAAAVALNIARSMDFSPFLFGFLAAFAFAVHGSYRHYKGYKDGIQSQADLVREESRLILELAEGASQALERAVALRDEARRTLQATKEAAQ